MSWSRVHVPIILCALVLLSGCVVGDDGPELTPPHAATSAPQPEVPTPTGTTIPSPTMTLQPTTTATTRAESRATSTPRPWPENCEPAQVDAFVQRVIDVFNAGDVTAMHDLLPIADAATKRNLLLATARAEPAAVDGVPVALEWFSMPRRVVVTNPPVEADYVVAHTADEVLAFVAEGYAAGLRMELRSVTHSRDWLPTAVTFGVETTLQLPDGSEQLMEGKAGIDCGHQRLFVWSLGPDPQ